MYRYKKNNILGCLCNMYFIIKPIFFFLLQVQPDFIRLGNKVSQSQVVYTALKVS